MSDEECKDLVPISGTATIDDVIKTKARVLSGFEVQIAEINVIRELEEFTRAQKGRTIHDIVGHREAIKLRMDYRRLLLEEAKFRVNLLSSVTKDLQAKEGSHAALIDQIEKLEMKIRSLVGVEQKRGRKKNSEGGI